MKIFRNSLLGATILMGVGTTPAFAQQSAADAGTGDAGNEIVVTATRRATSIQDVPINISAVSSEQINRQRIDDIRDIAISRPA